MSASTTEDRIDLQIIGACNELMDLKAGTGKMKVDNQNERARLNRELDQRKLELNRRIQALRTSKDLAVYRQACDQVFAEQRPEEDGRSNVPPQMPPLAAARQAQLCMHVHVMTMMENQLDLMREHKLRELTALEMELNKVRADMMAAEVQLLNNIVRLNQENREFKEWAERPIYVKKKTNKAVIAEAVVPKSVPAASETKARTEAEAEATPSLPNDDDKNNNNNGGGGGGGGGERPTAAAVAAAFAASRPRVRFAMDLEESEPNNSRKTPLQTSETTTTTTTRTTTTASTKVPMASAMRKKKEQSSTTVTKTHSTTSPRLEPSREAGNIKMIVPARPQHLMTSAST